MRKIVITGGPCSGKTTLTKELSQRGAYVVQEAALQLIEEENRGEKKIYPWTDYAEFNKRLIKLQKSLEEKIPREISAAYLDRSLIDSAAYLRLRNLPIPTELENAIKSAEYSLFFILDMLPEKHWAQTDGRPARMQSYSEGQIIHEAIEKTYASYGIKLMKIPVMSVEKRADFIENIVKENKMRETITMDDSITLYNEEYQDHYHSKIGAVHESINKFVRPANIAGRKQARILDIGFGIGYTCAAAIEEFFDNGGENLELISLEKDAAVLKEVANLNPKLKYFDAVKSAAKDLEYVDGSFDGKLNHELKIKIIIGDATDTIKNLKDDYFDIVFADGFAPAKNPELWTLDFFKEVAKKIKKEGILTTYSYARSVRENLAAAGFLVNDGPIIGRRSPSLIAIKNTNKPQIK